jgi:hypothetical protein
MTKINITKSVVILACLLGYTTTNAQFAQSAKVVSDNRESRAEHGTSVAIAENIAVVGASRETIASGAAYVYTKDSQGVWGFSQRLAATDPNYGAEYGGAVKISDDYLVVAAGRADVGTTIRAGALYIYDQVNNNWELNTKLVASDLNMDAKLGMNPTSLDAEGNTIVGGAPGDNGWTGAVYVFSKVAGTWTETQKIVSPNPQAEDAFGIGVSISGDTMAIGANAVNGGKGAVYIFTKNNSGTWEYAQTLVASDGVNNDFFGTSVSLTGDQMVIGAYGVNQETGAAYIFERDSQGIWSEVQKVTGNPSSESTQFGWDTAIQQGYIAVSAPHIFGLELGEVYFYKRESSGTWVEAQIVQGSDTIGEDFYGWSLAIDESQLMVGAPRQDFDVNGNNEMDSAGAAYIFNDPNLLGGMADYNSDINKVSLYPNPTQNTINIKSFSKPIVDLKVYAISGALLQQINGVNNNDFALNISNYSNGIYFVNLTLDGGSTTVHKIIKN